MLRCVLLLSAVLAGLSPSTSAAQPQPGHRVFPAQALRGVLLVGQPPEVLVDGQPALLAPGVRIRSADNLITPAARWAGQATVVHYRREVTTGMLLDVWVLNPVELANKPWPSTPKEAAAWRFDPSSQTWAKP